VILRCQDGYALRCAVWPAAEPALPLTVVVASAMLVRRRFYAKFASFLASQGVRTLTVSNRGVGLSLQAESRDWPHRLAHWGERDLPAALDWARRTEPSHRLAVVGHSMGGQLLGLSKAIDQLDAVVTVAATAAYWGHWPRPQRWGIRAWYAAAPQLARGLGALPAEHVRMGPNTHMGLIRDWALWGRHPDYLFGDRFGLADHAASYRGRVRAYSFSDDVSLGCSAAVDALHEHFPVAQLARHHVRPEQLGLAGIGHFGFFRQASEPLWRDTLEWLRHHPEAVG
jgi:predicted alpha/beta hydrolase